MKKKLYIFGLGNTCSRVFETLPILFAYDHSHENDFDTIIPIILGNSELNQTLDIIRLYQKIQNQTQHSTVFFKQKIKTINELSKNSSVVEQDNFKSELKSPQQNTINDNFDTFIGDSINSKKDKNLINLLFSDNNLNSDLNVGFKGNPNIGTIVLNQFLNNQNFKKFVQTFNDGDSIFITASIFGETGATGFPFLIKNIRAHAKTKESRIETLIIIPHITLDKNDSINSHLERKAITAATINYYNKTLADDNLINIVYHNIRNKEYKEPFEYYSGKKVKINKSYLHETVWALSILDFIKSNNVNPESPCVKKFSKTLTKDIVLDILNKSELLRKFLINNIKDRHQNNEYYISFKKHFEEWIGKIFIIE